MNLPEINKLDKRGIQRKALDDAQELIDNGQVDPVEVLTHARKIREYLDSYLKGLDSAVRDEVMKYSGKIERDGVKLELGSTGDRLDYMADGTYKGLYEQLKHREALLKLAFNSKDDVVDSDGCIVEPPPIKSASKEILRVTL